MFCICDRDLCIFNFFTGSGVIHFQDFQHLVAKRVKTLNGADELREAFRVYDRERKGYISSGEFRQIVSQIGDNVTPEDIDEMVKEADLNKNGRIEYEGLLETTKFLFLEVYILIEFLWCCHQNAFAKQL